MKDSTRDRILRAVATILWVLIFWYMHSMWQQYTECKEQGKVYVRAYFSSKRGCIDEGLIQ